MLFSKLYKIMVKKITFVGFRGFDRPPWIRPWPGSLVSWNEVEVEIDRVEEHVTKDEGN